MTTLSWRKGPRVATTVTAFATLAMLGAAAFSSTVVSAQAAKASVPATGGSTPAVHLLSSKWGGVGAGASALNLLGANQPLLDPGSLFTVTSALGARSVWKRKDAAGQPVTGNGVTVALLDSGISAVPGLDAPGKIIYGPDFTADTTTPDNSTTDNSASDDFGHGTFMAGLIAANDPVSRPVTVDKVLPASQEGLAPGADLLSVKLAGADGATSVDAVIAGLLWVVAHKNDNGMNVRVVNLSFGATALQPYQQDPLAAATEAAWRAGIVVVVSAGNAGAASGGLDDPALDPFVISVGASDPQGSIFGWKRPVVADFSSRGTADRHADVMAPGRSLVSLRDPGSTIDLQNPDGRVKGDRSGRLFRGSGTSEATAVVSGSVALLLQAHPELTPDQVKATLTATADPVTEAASRVVDPLDSGSGQLDLQAALGAADRIGGADDFGLGGAVQSYPYSTGLEGVDPGDLTGSWDGARWNGARWNGARWNGARWNGDTWSAQS